MASKATQTSKAGPQKTVGAESCKSNKIYCYIGPNIRGYLHSGQVFRGERADILKAYAPLVEKHPLVKNLLVPGESLAVARRKVQEPGTAHHANCQKLSRELLEGTQEKVRPEFEAYQKGHEGNV